MARWCARHGAQVRAWDSRAEPPAAATLASELPEVERLAGELDAGRALEGCVAVLKSPGLAPGDTRIAAVLSAAAERGIAVQGELGLFAEALDVLAGAIGYAPKVLAITGTNGKTTTTAMTAQLVESTGRRVAVAGNIGPTMLQTLADALDAVGEVEVAAAQGGAGALGNAAAAAAAFAATDAAGGHVDAASGDDADTDSSAADTDSAAADADPATDAADAAAPEGGARGARAFDSAAAGGEASADAGARDPAATRVEPDESDADGDDSAEADPARLEALLAAPTAPAPVHPALAELPEVWVLELSSFQLDGVTGFEPSAAALLNLTQDHLDWHGSFDAYVAAKARVFGARAVIVANRDDPAVEAALPAAPAPKKRVRSVPRQVVRFGIGAPTRAGDFGIVIEHGIAWLARAIEPERDGGRRARAEAASSALQMQRLMPADALRVRGRHNAANALAALALASAIGCGLAPMLHALREYRGEPHRVEFIATIDGIDAFDDSKGTNVGATVAALDGLGADRAPARLAVILGGDGKGQDFAPLLAPLGRHARAIATIGRDADAIERVVGATGLPLTRHPSLEAATRWCFEQAQPGDAVLLSPACASLDMFRDYAHRAAVFVDTVRAIAADRAGVMA
ncbi:UDP-N-acetylmuramoyl-L-alanine--D-glutamate ligase [Schlegelella sp. ID0723]|uniref:UDP-N-acetylmuramoylalanine--D-glutamate ligase n=2 Tax=Piscinibacter koreensis TaxID=2742824 RepID=A0A7Y6TZ45_9BURK|nr:UDP-N-acetylmuramoyl-L-alanine--D-glutamate ligase [Schlegelella koreensis]